jgi:hypothetical protein
MLSQYGKIVSAETPEKAALERPTPRRGHIHSEGITALAEAPGDLGEVVVVAPVRERSAVRRSLTLGA